MGSALRRLGVGTKDSSGLAQVVSGGIRRGLGPVGCVNLVEDVAHVGAHGPGADEQLLGYLSVGLADGDQAQNLSLSLREPSG